MKFNKNIFAFAICLAMFCPVKSDDQTIDGAIAMKKIVITTQAPDENGQLVKNELVINAIVVSPEQAQELINNNQAYRVTALENSMPYNKVFVIGETAYFMTTPEASSVSRSINVTDFIVDENGRQINPAQEEIIEAIAADLI